MKTHNYAIDLMIPMQINKDIVFNEAISKIDSQMQISVNGFINEVPQQVLVGERYILTSGQKQQCIIYCIHKSKGWQYLMPSKNMVIFSIPDNAFFVFDSNKWVKIHIGSNKESFAQGQKFRGIEGSFDINDDSSYLYLYMNNNCKIDISSKTFSVITVMIKQNYQLVYKLEWVNKILWPKQQIHQISQTPNAIDVLRLHRLPEIDYFIGEIGICGVQL